MVRIQRCTVRFSNSCGVERSTEVEAASVFEAACRGWAKFKSSDETFDESYRTDEFIIEVHEAPKTYKVNLEKLLRWLDERRRGPADGLHRKRLRKLLDANLNE
jgi:hypothetical protein